MLVSIRGDARFVLRLSWTRNQRGNRSGNFSVERLMDFLTALGHDVEIRVKRTRKPHGQMSVVVAA